MAPKKKASSKKPAGVRRPSAASQIEGMKAEMEVMRGDNRELTRRVRELKDKVQEKPSMNTVTNFLTDEIRKVVEREVKSMSEKLDVKELGNSLQARMNRLEQHVQSDASLRELETRSKQLEGRFDSIEEAAGELMDRVFSLEEDREASSDGGTTTINLNIGGKPS